MTRTREPDVDALLRSADPELRRPTPGADRTPGADDRGRLDELRRQVDVRVTHELHHEPPAHARSVPQGSTWRRRAVVGLAVAAVAVPAALAVQARWPVGASGPLRTAGISVRVASDGQLSCSGGGYARPIVPRTASQRLLPATLPTGWSLTEVFARSTTGSGACTTPSLVALASDADGTITGTLAVTGPFRADLGEGSLGSLASDSVDGHRARRFSVEDTAVDGEVPFHRWLWTDDLGQQWQAEDSGFSLAQARSALTAVSTEGTRVVVDTGKAPGLRVAHLRRGEPYRGDATGLDWYLHLSDGGAERDVEVHHTDDSEGEDARTFLAKYAVVGARQTVVGGHPALVLPTAPAHPADGAGPAEAASTPVVVQLDDGTVAWGWARGDLADVEAVLASLTEVSRDDTRLTRYAGE